MKIKGGKVRCDSCGSVVEESHPDAKTFRGFYIPPSVSLVTGEYDGRFPGIARAGDPKRTVQLHACQECRPKIKACTSNYDFALLPDGPLKKILRELLTADQLRRMNVLPAKRLPS